MRNNPAHTISIRATHFHALLGTAHFTGGYHLHSASNFLGTFNTGDFGTYLF